MIRFDKVVQYTEYYVQQLVIFNFYLLDVHWLIVLLCQVLPVLFKSTNKSTKVFHYTPDIVKYNYVLIYPCPKWIIFTFSFHEKNLDIKHFVWPLTLVPSIAKLRFPFWSKAFHTRTHIRTQPHIYIWCISKKMERSKCTQN